MFLCAHYECYVVTIYFRHYIFLPEGDHSPLEKSRPTFFPQNKRSHRADLVDPAREKLELDEVRPQSKGSSR
ncbi:hypothetical protein Mapa_006538 [Marchantia paleacea]|nr:hypothetical protein Mapa_006538 [Marchantia paleacea]